MATVDARFENLMTDMENFCQKEADYYSGTSSTEGKPWMVPESDTDSKLTGWIFSPFNIEGMKTPFDRTDVNQLYQDEYDPSKADSGSADNEIRVAMGANLQIAYMGMMERSFRERHKTPCRALLHATGRKKAHGDASTGVHKQYVQNYITQVFDA